MRISKKIRLQYPAIIPELDYGGNDQVSVNKSSFKYRLLSTFFYKRIDDGVRVYLHMAFSGKKHYMPLFTMTKALALYNEGDSIGFSRVAKSLISEMDEHGWKHKNLLQLPGYHQKYSSYSCLINGRGLGVLIRYYALHPSKDLLLQIRSVLHSFEIVSSQGGVLHPSGAYLEYSWGDDSPIVWNGFMSALIGLHDCYVNGPKSVQKKSKQLFDKGLAVLVSRQKELFYVGRFFEWIRYDTNKLYFADGPYMKIETRQLEYLSKIDSRLEESLKRIKNIQKKYKNIARLYEYYYFVKKKVMR